MPARDIPPGYCTMLDYAVRTGQSLSAAYWLLNQGLLPARRVGCSWLIAGEGATFDPGEPDRHPAYRAQLVAGRPSAAQPAPDAELPVRDVDLRCPPGSASQGTPQSD